MSSTILLSSKHEMPIIGIGTCLISKKEAIETTLKTALKPGCRRFIDTAYGYMNQHLIGEVLKGMLDRGDCKREDLFIIDKLPNHAMKPEHVEEYYTKSSKALQVDYIDLYLIHSPISTKYNKEGLVFPQKDGLVEQDEVDLLKTWKAMELLVDNGKVRSLGLCNFNSEQVRRIYNGATIKPSTLEIECHAYFPQYELQEICSRLGISLTANCPLGKPHFPPEALEEMESDYTDAPDLLAEARVMKLAENYKKSPAQILLRYLVQRNIVPIPQSVDADRIEENIKITDFIIAETDMATLASLKTRYRFITLGWKGLKGHPHYPFGIDF